MPHTCTLRAAKALWELANVVLLLGWLAGCAGSADLVDGFHAILPVRGDLVAEGKVKTELAPGPSLDLSAPSVQRVNLEVVIAGTVTRRSGCDGDVPGFLALQVIGPTGVLTDEVTMHWFPEVIPSGGSRAAKYGARLLGLPQEGSTIRIAYFDGVASLRASGAEVGRHLPTTSPATAPVPPAEISAHPVVEMVELSNVQVRLVSAKIAKVKSQSADGKEVYESVRPQLSIVLEIKNISDNNRCQYKTWGTADPVADDNAAISDGLGHGYQMERYGFGDRPIGRIDTAQIDPGKRVTDVLVFVDVPSDGTAWMSLDLPARNVGETGVLRLQFPASVIQR